MESSAQNLPMRGINADHIVSGLLFLNIADRSEVRRSVPTGIKDLKWELAAFDVQIDPSPCGAVSLEDLAAPAR